MSWFGVLLEPKIRLKWLESLPEGAISVNGKTYYPRPSSAVVPVFYDWMRDPYNHRIAGIELHILPDHLSLLPLIQGLALDYADQAPFLRIWFQQERKGISDGLEAFDDIHFLGTNEDEWLILVGTKHWISSEDAEWLKTLATQTE